MYFLHLMGFLAYEEKDTIAIYSDKKDIFKTNFLFYAFYITRVC